MTGAAIAKMESDQTHGSFATFHVADLFFGVDVLRVQEVLRSQPMTRVPRGPEVIEGLINLRGQIVTAIDMRRRLGLAPRPADAAPMNVVVRTEDAAVSLLVDAIGDVLDVDSDAFERPPENLDAGARELIRGVYKLEDRLLLVLDVEETVGLADAKPAEAAKAVPWHSARGVARTGDTHEIQPEDSDEQTSSAPRTAPLHDGSSSLRRDAARPRPSENRESKRPRRRAESRTVPNS